MNFFSLAVLLITMALPFMSLAEEEAPSFKEQAVGIAVDTIKANIPDEYEDEVESLQEIHQHINAIDVSKPDEAAAHMGEIKKNLDKLDDATGVTKKIKSSNYYDRAVAYCKELYEQALEYWEKLTK